MQESMKPFTDAEKKDEEPRLKYEKYMLTRNVKNSITASIVNDFDKSDNANQLSQLLIRNGKEMRELYDSDPSELLNSMLFDLIWEYKTLSSHYTLPVLIGASNRVILRSCIEDKMKVDEFLLKILTTRKSLGSAARQLSVNGKTVNVAFAQQFTDQNNQTTKDTERSVNKDADLVNASTPRADTSSSLEERDRDANQEDLYETQDLF